MKTLANKIGKGKRVDIALIFLLMSLLSVIAETGIAAEARLTLPEAVKAALENNHELKALKNSHAAKQADIGIARSYLLPKISLEERYLRTVNPTYAFMTKLNQQRIELSDFAPDSLNHPDAVNDFQTSVSFEQPLFVRKATVGLEMSKMEVEASEETLQRKKEEIAFKVVQTYLMVSTAGGYVKVAEKALEDTREHQRLADVRYKAGLGLYSDVLRASTAAADAGQKLVSAGKNFSVAKRALGLMIGSGEAIDVMQETPALPVRDIEDLRTQSLARKDIKALELRKENAKNNIKLAEAGYFPLLGVGGAYQLNDHSNPLGNEGDSWQLMAFLKWDLFDGAKRKHEKTKANHQVSEADEYLKGMKKMVSFQVDEAWLTLEEAKSNVALAQEALKSAEEGRRLVKVRYEGSLSPIVDMLDVQVSYDHMAANLVARENEYKLAIANLCFASGTIIQDLQLEEQKGR
ncbi:MAG: TolC family protein [Syntrophales bacterium]|nr:TolC family protein [Syntrophales bacterium]